MKENIKHFYDDGNLMCVGGLIDGIQHGEWIFYHENGNVYRKGDFENGNPIGNWMEYYENGDLCYISKDCIIDIPEHCKELIEYRNIKGEVKVKKGNGEFTLILDKKDKAVMNIKDGKIHGDLLYYSDSKVVRKVSYYKGFPQ